MKNFRQELESGAFVAIGKHSSNSNSGDSVTSKSRQFEIRCEFDKENLRFHRIEPKLNGLYLKSGGDITTHIGSEKAIVKNPVDAVGAQIIRPFDVRTVGLLTSAELNEGISINRLFELLKDDDSAEIEQSDSGEHIITWVISGSQSTETRRRYWINSEQGFSPYRMEVRAREKERGVSWDDLPIIAETETRWKQINGTWVPESCEMLDAYGAVALFLSFRWKSVNTGIASDRFTAASVTVPAGTYVIDNSLGTPILENVTGEPKTPLVKQTDKISWRVILIWVNVILIVAIAFVLLVRKRILAE